MVQVKSFEKHWGIRVQSVEIEQMSYGVTGLLDIYPRSTRSLHSLGSSGFKLKATSLSVREKALRLHRQLHSLRFNRAARPCLRSSLPTSSATPKRMLRGLKLFLKHQVNPEYDAQGLRDARVLRGQVGSSSIGIWTRGENMRELGVEQSCMHSSHNHVIFSRFCLTS
jgi:hypothetical protein